MRTKPRIHIIGTGGTIGYRPTSQAEAVALTAQRMDIADLVAALPGMDGVDITSGQLFQIGSTSITDAHWLLLAKRINALFEGDGADGVVVTHGTDTLEETAYFLNLTVRYDRPVVITGAMRHAGALGYDGTGNLYDAILVAAHGDSAGRGVTAVMDGQILSAREVYKGSSYRPGAFTGGYLGQVVHGRVDWHSSPTKRHTIHSEFDPGSLGALPRVDVIYGHAGCGDAVFRFLCEQGADGIVFAGLGNGFMPEPIREAYAAGGGGLPVLVRSSRVPTGGVELNFQMDDDRYGSLTAGTLSPQKARILLKLALARTRNLGELRRIFSEY